MRRLPVKTKTFIKNLLIVLILLLTNICIYGQTHKKGRKSHLEKEELFYVLDKAPEFPGGIDSLYSFIGRNLNYPETAVRDGIEGKVVITFVIEITGKVTNPEVIEGILEDLSHSATELINKIPDWIPAEIGGKKVRIRQTLPLNFKL